MRVNESKSEIVTFQRSQAVNSKLTKNFVAVMIIFLLVSKLGFGQENQLPKRYALLVAVTTYEHSQINRPQLKYPVDDAKAVGDFLSKNCLLYTSPSPRDRQKSRMPSSA